MSRLNLIGKIPYAAESYAPTPSEVRSPTSRLAAVAMAFPLNQIAS